MALTEMEIRSMKPKNVRYMKSDGQGLYIAVQPNGEKFWYYRYKKYGVDRKMSLGRYPDVSLKQARELRYTQQKNSKEKTPTSFKDIAEDWVNTHVIAQCTPKHVETIRYRLNRFLYPVLGKAGIDDIKAFDLLPLLRKIQDGGHIETAHRVHQLAGQVFRYGISVGVCSRDITADMRGALIPKVNIHRATMRTRAEAADLIRAMTSFQGGKIVRGALWLLAYTFVRPGELNAAEWAEVDMDAGEWKIPSEKMKMRRPHIIPLSTQAVELLKSVHQLSGHGRYIFMSTRTPNGSAHISGQTIVAALRRIGYGPSEMSAHGFRAMASTLLNENGWPPDVIERQLAHVERNAVRAAYNHAEYLPERRKMMQWWADYLDNLIKK